MEGRGREEEGTCLTAPGNPPVHRSGPECTPVAAPPRGPPHVHAFYGESEAQIGIEPIALLNGVLPARAASMVFEWAALHQRELMQNWRRLRNDQPAERIEPLRKDGIMSPRVNHVRYVSGYRLELGFTGGLRKEIDFKDRILGRGGLFPAGR